MSLAVRFLPHSAYVNGSSWINQIESTAPNAGVTLFEESTGSATDREFVAEKSISPTLPIATSDLTILSSIGFNGVPITSPGIVVFGRELPLEALPTAIGTAHHLTLTCVNGLLVPVSIRASHNSAAVLSLMLHGISVAGSQPFTWLANQTITSGAGVTSNIFTTGPIKFGTRLVQGIQDINIDFGLGINKESDSGEVYPTHIAIMARMPKIEFTTSDVELASEVGDGVAISTFAAYFRRVSANGQRDASSNTTHISIAGTAGLLTPGSTTLGHKKSGRSAFTFTPVLNTNIITISTTAAIPTS